MNLPSVKQTAAGPSQAPASPRDTRRIRADRDPSADCATQGSGINIIIACGSDRPPMHQKFQRIVQTGGVALLLGDDRIQLLQVLAEQLGFEPALARAHPVDVALQRVDLAVVANVAIGMGQRPGGKRVRAEASMHEGRARWSGCYRRDPDSTAESDAAAAVLYRRSCCTTGWRYKNTLALRCADSRMAFSTHLRITYKLRSNCASSVNIAARDEHLAHDRFGACAPEGRSHHSSPAHRASPELGAFFLDHAGKDGLALSSRRRHRAARTPCPTPYSPAPGNLIPASFATRLKNSCGT